MPAIDEMNDFDEYTIFLYFGSCILGATMYGDVVPYTISEELVAFGEMFFGKLFIAFLFAEAANYLTEKYEAEVEYRGRLSRIKTWA